jgi:hypothetical protein
MSKRFPQVTACVAVLLLVGLSTLPRLSAQGDLPLNAQVPLLLRVLAYDRALSRSGEGDVVIAVLYDAANPTSSGARSAFARTVRAGTISTVNGRAIRIVEINVAGGQVDTELARTRAVAAYLTPGLDGRLDQLVAAARSSGTLLMTGSPGWVRRGVSVGVGSEGGRPRIFINLPAARAAGADLPANLLQIATVIQ